MHVEIYLHSRVNRMSQKTTRGARVLLMLCVEITHANTHVRTAQAPGNTHVPCVKFWDIRLTRECM